MSRYESPGQVALLLAGATLASLLLIMLFTAETKNRRPSRELVAEGDGALSSMQQVTRLAPGEGPSGGGGRRAKRGLGGGAGVGRSGRPVGMEVSRGDEEEEDEEEEDERPLPPTSTTTTPRPRHALRHRHRQHSRHRQASSTPHPHATPPAPRGDGSSGGRGWAEPPDGAAAVLRATTTSSGEDDDVVSSSPRDGHAACYGPDQVVLIIALTCALNFACIFLVMALVHICNRNRKCASSGCDSPLLLVDSDYEAEGKACPAGGESADEEEDEDEDEYEEEVDALLLTKRPFAASHAFLHSHHAFAPGFRPHHTPWRPCLGASAHPPLLLGAERRRCGPLPSSASAIAVGGASNAPTCRPLLPPAAFSMEDLHILE